MINQLVPRLLETQAVLQMTAEERTAAAAKMTETDPKDAAAAVDKLMDRLHAAVVAAEEAACKGRGFDSCTHEKRETACKSRGHDSCAAEVTSKKDTAAAMESLANALAEVQAAEQAPQITRFLAAIGNADDDGAAETVDSLLKFTDEEVIEMMKDLKYMLPKRKKMAAAIARSSPRARREGREGAKDAADNTAAEANA